MPVSKRQDRIAFDRAASKRTIDQDGHLHVSQTHISKACVNPYYGREIPNSEELGLEPNTIYKLLRDPKELEKAAASFNNKPLLNLHKPQTAKEGGKDGDLRVGTLSNVQWNPPYLDADIAVWVQESIDLIESKDQCELSSSYRYVADMTPGTFEGEDYDGVMRDILGNHTALVEEGRAGSDVVVADAAITPRPRKFVTGKFASPIHAGIVGRAFHSKFTQRKTA